MLTSVQKLDVIRGRLELPKRCEGWRGKGRLANENKNIDKRGNAAVVKHSGMTLAHKMHTLHNTKAGE